jgi:hypothetical protein
MIVTDERSLVRRPATAPLDSGNVPVSQLVDERYLGLIPSRLGPAAAPCSQKSAAGSGEEPTAASLVGGWGLGVSRPRSRHIGQQDIKPLACDRATVR